MGGERVDPRSASPTQPGGRAPAPGELALVQSFINTHYDLEVEHGADLFATPRALADWFSARGLIERSRPPTSREWSNALRAREALREIARGNGRRTDAPDQVLAREGAYERLGAAARGACVEIRLTSAGPHFHAGRGGRLTGGLGVVLALTASAMADGSWARLKVCAGQGCGWAFYDHSRNQMGRWCSMSVCGGRAKAHAHYQRMREQLQ